jgi:DnaJ-class molecular chaperone
MEKENKKICERCNGSGIVWKQDRWLFPINDVCRECNGTGYADNKRKLELIK